MSQAVYEKITNRIIEGLDKGVVPWKKPWKIDLPKNLKSKKQYNGINLLMLLYNEHQSPWYATFNQIKELGGTVKKGEKGYLIVFWKINEYEKVVDGKTETVEVPFIRYSHVFNSEQCEGITVPETEKNEEILECKSVYDDMLNKPKLEHKSTGAYYNPQTDIVNVPHIDTFEDVEEYYSTLFHELVHSTGHESRLSREGITKIDAYGNEKYSFEELVAEIGNAFLCAETQISNGEVFDNSQAYINGWISKLKSDPKLIIKASSKAQEAVNYILNR